MAARKSTAKRQPKRKSAKKPGEDATATVPAGQETGTTTVERSRATDGQNR